MRILFLSRWFPAPADNGSKIRIFNLLKQLASKHQIALISFTAGTQPIAKAALHKFCTEVHAIPYHPFQPTRLRALMGLFSPRPRSVVDTYSQEMAHCVQQVTSRFQPDLVFATEIDMAPYALLVRNVPRLLDELQLTVLHEAAQRHNASLAHLRRTLTWHKHRRYVATTLQNFAGCTVVSELEYAQVQQLATPATRLALIPNGVDTQHMHNEFGTPVQNTLVYAGALTFDANLDAMHYFVQDIFPLLVARVPQAQLKITGSTEGVPNHQLPVHPNLALTGYLTDIRPTIAQSNLSIVPLRIGGGTRLKILESLALGTPVVATHKGIEGLNFDEAQGVLIADTPAAFADAIERVLQNPALHQQLSKAGRAAVQAYDWQQIGDSLLAWIDEIAFAHRSPSQSIYPKSMHHKSSKHGQQAA